MFAGRARKLRKEWSSKAKLWCTERFILLLSLLFLLSRQAVIVGAFFFAPNKQPKIEYICEKGFLFSSTTCYGILFFLDCFLPPRTDGVQICAQRVCRLNFALRTIELATWRWLHAYECKNIVWHQSKYKLISIKCKKKEFLIEPSGIEFTKFLWHRSFSQKPLKSNQKSFHDVFLQIQTK